MGTFLFVMLLGGSLAYLNRKAIFKNNPHLRALISELLARMEAYFTQEKLMNSLLKIALVLIGLFIIGGSELKAWVILLAIIGVLAYFNRDEIRIRVASFKKNYLQPDTVTETELIDKKITPEKSNPIVEEGNTFEPIEQNSRTSADFNSDNSWTEQKEIAKILAMRKQRISYEEAEENEPKEETHWPDLKKSGNEKNETDEPAFMEINSPTSSETIRATETDHEPKEIVKVLAQRKSKKDLEERKQETTDSKPLIAGSIFDRAVSFLQGFFSGNRNRYDKKENPDRANDERERRSRDGNYLK